METNLIQLHAVRRLDRDALAEVFDEYSPALFKYVMRTCDDPLLADEIVGEVFSRLLGQLSCGRGPHSNLRSYLFETTYHTLVDSERYFSRRVPLSEVEDSFLSDEQSGDPFLENEILTQAISDTMREKLTEYQRQVIMLRFMEGCSLKETALILGKSVNIIKATQNRAMVTLRKCLYPWVMG